ncbi:hypothetical protein CKJ89_03250 [Klebsiella pneumoniae]|nr:hypothetical protein CKJ89_03250 [Klebsiella pneumoniae]
MKLGILFPVAIFIIAVVFLGWFFVGGYAARVGIMKKSTIIMLVVAIVAVAGTQFGWW